MVTAIPNTIKSTSVENSVAYQSLIIHNNDSLKYTMECFKISKYYFQNYSDRLERVFVSLVLDLPFDPKTVVSQELKKYSTFRGYQLTIKKGKNNYKIYRIFLVNEILYAMGYSCPGSGLYDTRFTKFFDSFEIEGIKNDISISNIPQKPYSIAFNTPTKSELSQRMTQNYGNIEIYSETGEPREDGNNLNYGVAYAKLPVSSDSISNKDINFLFKEFISGAENSLPAKLISESEIKFNNIYPGRQVKLLWFFNNTNVIIRTRYYLIKNYLFVLQVYFIEDRENVQQTSHFFNSFKPMIKN